MTDYGFVLLAVGFPVFLVLLIGLYNIVREQGNRLPLTPRPPRRKVKR